MLEKNATFTSVYGSGHLLLDDGSSPMVGYKLVLNIENFSGGGFILGLNEEDSVKVANLVAVRLSLGDRYLALIVGRYDGDWLPARVIGLTTGPDKQRRTQEIDSKSTKTKKKAGQHVAKYRRSRSN